jgi:hypothetical protein
LTAVRDTGIKREANTGVVGHDRPRAGGWDTEEMQMNPSFKQQLRQEFDLTAPMATWIVITHFFVLACPLALMWAVGTYGDSLSGLFAYPILVQLASAIYIGSTAFEVAQNSADRWYLTEATRSVADLAFNAFMTVAFCLYTIGFLGLGWISLVTVALTLLFPFAYIVNHPSHRGLSGAVVLIATIGLYWVTRDPAVFLFMVGNGLGVYFITIMVKQRAQWLHGWAAFFFGLGFLSWPWALINTVNGTPLSWLYFAGIVIAIGIVAAALTPLLSRAKETPRQYS